MDISNKVIYRRLGENLIIEDIEGKFLHKINKFGKIIFYFIKDSDSLVDAKRKVFNYFNNENIKIIDSNFNKFVKFLNNYNIINNKFNKAKKREKTFNNNDLTNYIKVKNEISSYAFENRIPLRIQIEFETKCNYNCVHCYLNGSREIAKSLYLKEEQYKKLFDDLDTLGTREIIFSGGEPFLRNNFKKILNLTKNYGFMIKIFTNGSLITDEYIKILQKIRLKKLQISFYGNETEYNKFSRTSNYFRKVTEILEKLKENNIKFYLAIPLTKINLSSITFFENLSQKYECNFYSFILDPLYGKNKNISQKIMLSPQHEYVQRFVKPKIRKQIKSYQGRCVGGITQAAINAKGSVFPCYDYISPVGSLHNNSFKDIWENSNDLKNIVKINLRGNLNEKCNKCKYNEFCFYCFGKNFKETGDPQKLAKMVCNMAKYEYEIYNK